jgi:hypothetical protein
MERSVIRGNSVLTPDFGLMAPMLYSTNRACKALLQMLPVSSPDVAQRNPGRLGANPKISA